MDARLIYAKKILEDGHCANVVCHDCPCWSQHRCSVSFSNNAFDIAEKFIQMKVLENPEECMEAFL